MRKYIQNRGWIISATSLSAILILFLALTGSSCRWFSEPDVDMVCMNESFSVFQGEKVLIPMEITNNLAESLRPSADLFISYHLYHENGKSLSYDNRRFEIPKILRRQKTTSFQLPVYFDYPEPGNYVVEFDIVKEGKFWGSSKKWKTARVKLQLKPIISEDFRKKYMPVFQKTGNKQLDAEQHLLRLTLKNCEIRKDNKLFGFAAGSTYPAVWIRDTATFISYAKEFYPLDQLAFGLELFLERQGTDGEITDNVDISGQTDKNTVETDQESSLVLAAYQIATSDPQWLQKEVNGIPVLDRLEKALDWVWTSRLDNKYQLITSGFTADWGDVENTYPDKRARKLSDKSTLVLGIYTQAKYIQAMDCLIKLIEYAEKGDNPHKQSARAAKWRQRLEVVKTQTRKHLYLKDKGYYITHIVPSTNEHFEMESQMLAVGGNAEAMIAGLMDENEIRRFLNVLNARRKEHKLRTVSFVLIPPYPDGFFKHHLLRHPWNYQNGGEWDWIGARVVKGLFLNGFPKEAETYLLEIVKKNLTDYCIFEWGDLRGTGRGALFYVGAAGVIGESILIGYSNRNHSK